MNSTDQEFKKFKDLIKKIKNGILITRHENDQLKGRPMQTADIDEEGVLWFFTNEFSEKTTDISNNNEAFLSYAEPAQNYYLTINGDAELADDENKMKELWSPAFKLWFPKGLDDPNLMLIKVTPKQVEYWDNNDNDGKIEILFNRVKLILKGRQYNDEGHKKIEV